MNSPGEKIKWQVTFRRNVVEEGTAIVEAASEEEAAELAQKLNLSDWCVDYPFEPSEFFVEEIKPI